MTMGDIVSRLRQFLSELKRRKVYQIGVVYAAAAFVVWQAAEIAVPAVGLPSSAVTFVVVVSLLGFPIALVLAWALEITPDGVAVTRPQNEEAKPALRGGGSIRMSDRESDPEPGSAVGSESVGRAPVQGTGSDPTSRPPNTETPRLNELAQADFLLTEEICRKVDRRTLDPRIIGDRLSYLDNQVDSDVLTIYLHGLGLDGHQFADILEMLPYRALAPTLYGFERTPHHRIPLSLDDHVTLVREFIRSVTHRLQPATTVLVGFSVGADLGFHVIGAQEYGPALPVDGYLSIGANLSLDTCFASSLVARISTHDPSRLLDDLRSLGQGVSSLDEWLNVHEYFVQVFRKFDDDTEALRRVADELVAPWRVPDSNPFIGWYRDASARLESLVCVFSDTPEENAALEQIKLRNLDAAVLGEHYRPGSLVLESGADHFELLEPDRHFAHLRYLLEELR